MICCKRFIWCKRLVSSPISFLLLKGSLMIQLWLFFLRISNEHWEWEFHGWIPNSLSRWIGSFQDQFLEPLLEKAHTSIQSYEPNETTMRSMNEQWKNNTFISESLPPNEWTIHSASNSESWGWRWTLTLKFFELNV